MAQFSGFWTTGGATGDQVAGYTQAHWSTAGSIFAACSGFEGVAPGWEATDEFLTTDAGGGNLSVGTGAAMVDGKWFENDAPVTVNIPTPAAGNARIDRIVARVVWANFTVRITRIVGTAAAIPVAPAITQTSGATYDIPLYQAYITDGGVITLTDERKWASAVLPRTRTFFVPAVGGYNDTTADDLPFYMALAPALLGFGVATIDTNSVFVIGNFHVPEDFVSSMTVSAIVGSDSSGNAYVDLLAEYGAVGEAWDTHGDNLGSGVMAIVAGRRTSTPALSLPYAAVGDYVNVIFARDASNVADTMSGTVFVSGFLVSYTADS